MASAREFGLTIAGTSGGEELVICPFHDDRKPSAWFNPRTELFYCAVCGFGLNAVQLAQRLGVEREVSEEEYEKEPEDYCLVQDVHAYDLGENIYHPYFQERGICQHVIERFGVRWKESSPQAAVLPLVNLYGVTNGVVYRYLEPEEAGTRYKVYGKTYPVWPMDHLMDMPEGANVIVTEGAWSAMKLATYTVTRFHIKLFTVALLGAKANQQIVEVMRPFNPIYLYDNDQAGRQAKKRMLELCPTARAYVVNVSPDDMSDRQLGELLMKAV